MAAPRYATLAQLQAHIDVRVLQMLSSDDGLDAELNLSTNLKLAGALERASSDVESYARRGRRYSAADLASLATDGDTTLIGLVADLTLFHLAGRRGGELPPAVSDRFRNASDTLKSLGKGERIFGMDAGAESSGTAKVVQIDRATRSRIGMVSDSEFFPRRPDRIY